MDRAAAAVTSRAVATALRAGGSDVVGAEVEIHGFPFLTQLAAGHLEHVSGSIREGSFGGYRVSDVAVDARDVVPRPPWHAGALRVSGVVGFDTLAAALSERLGLQVTVGPAQDSADALLIGLPFTVLGASVEVAATAVPYVADGAVAVQVTGLSVGGAAVGVEDAPLGLGDLLGALTLPVALPEDVTLREVGVDPAGVRVEAEAHDVALGSLIR